MSDMHLKSDMDPKTKIELEATAFRRLPLVRAGAVASTGHCPMYFQFAFE